MKIGTFNIRGLGSLVKKDEVYSFFTKNDLVVCCIQETKMENFSEREVRRIWKNRGMWWSAEGVVGRSGGVLTFWDEERFCCSSSCGIGGAVVVNGREMETGDEYCIINMYAPYNSREKSLQSRWLLGRGRIFILVSLVISTPYWMRGR